MTSSSTSGSTTTTSSSSGGTTTGSDGCTANDECGGLEICSSAGICDADVHAYCYDVRVQEFDPVSCADGVGGGELYFEAWIGGSFAESSPETTCPGSWPDTSIEILAAQGAPPGFVLDFYEADAFFDDFEGSFCFDDGSGSCGPLDAAAIHDGGVEAELSNGATVALTIELVSCP